MLNLKIDKNLKIIYSVWIFLVLGSLVLLYSLPFVSAAEACFDSDYGLNIEIRGSCYVGEIGAWDSCGESITSVREYYCDTTNLCSITTLNCLPATKPYCYGGRCVECLIDAHCPTGEFCPDNVCVEFAEGEYIDYFGVESETTIPYGITTDGNFIWVVDNYPSEVYKYNMDGSYNETHWNPEIGTPSGMTTDGTNIWITHPLSDKVSKYNMDGTPDGTWDTASGNDDPFGITTDGNFIWIVDADWGEVYKYYMNGTYTETSWYMGAGNYPTGITTDGNFIWIVDGYYGEVYKHNMNGSYTGTSNDWNIDSGNTFPKGITTDGNFIWIVDSSGKKVYKYGGPLPPPPVDTCTCPGPGNNWVINMADSCDITSDCDLGTGKLSFIGTGSATCDSTISTTDLGDPGNGGTLFIDNNCIIYVD